MYRIVLLCLLAAVLPGTAHAREILPSEWSSGSGTSGGAVELRGAGGLEANLSTRLLRGIDFVLRARGCHSSVDLKFDGEVAATWRLRRGRLSPVGADVVSAPGSHHVELRLRRVRGCARHGLTVHDSTIHEWIPIGSDMAWRYVAEDPGYMRLYEAEVDAITAGVDMHWVHVHPERGVYDFDAADRIVEFGENHGKAVRGHPLVWDYPFMMPRWFNEADWTRAELIDVMRDHITTLVSRYRGRVDEWDVVNEPIAGDGSLRENVWLEVIGPEYIEMAFRFAHEADPDAKLYVNEFDVEVMNAKSTGLHRLVADLRARGVPVHGVGFQAHFVSGGVPSAGDIEANFERFAALGVDLHISEMDIADDGPDSPDRRELQATGFRHAALACRAEPACVRLTTWQLSDRYSWLGAERRPLPFDESLTPKPAWHALEEVMRPERM